MLFVFTQLIFFNKQVVYVYLFVPSNLSRVQETKAYREQGSRILNVNQRLSSRVDWKRFQKVNNSNCIHVSNDWSCYDDTSLSIKRQEYHFKVSMAHHKRALTDYSFVESFTRRGRNSPLWITDFLISKIKKSIFNTRTLSILLAPVCFGWKGRGNCGNCCQPRANRRVQ